MAPKLGMTEDLYKAYAHARFDDLDLDASHNGWANAKI